MAIPSSFTSVDGRFVFAVLAGIVGRLMGTDTWWVLFTAGTLGWTITVLRCVMFAWKSDLTGLPSIGLWSPTPSRHLYRALIAWLHLVQPIARSGEIYRDCRCRKGLLLSTSRAIPGRRLFPSLRNARAAVPALTGGRGEWSFWSESWTSQAALLTELVGVLRACRPAQLVHVDEGWHTNRDLSVSIGRWGWLHVLTLVEEHERGCCLFPSAGASSSRFAGTVHGLALAILLAGATGVSIALYRPSASVVASILAIAALALRAMWQATRAAAVLDQTVVRVTTAAGMLPLPVAPVLTPHATRPAETTLSRG